MDFFSIGLGLAGLSCVLGILWRVRGWPGRRLACCGHHISSRNDLPVSVGAGLADLVLLRRTLRSGRTGRLRWAGHMLVLLGFIPLLLLHALDDIVTRSLISGYEPTLEPWQSARNICGILALLGLSLLAWHRGKHLRALSRFQDWFLVGILTAVLFSGFVLEAAKIASPTDFMRMTEAYFPEGDAEEITALRAYWSAENGVRPASVAPLPSHHLEQGRELHEDRCAGCHAPTATAFVSRALADALPSSWALSQTLPTSCWYIHVALSFLLLALLPWGKFLHPLTTSANLMARGGRTDCSAHAPLALGLEACTRCGQCSLACSVAPSYRILGNPDILPMNKLANIHKWLSGNIASTGLQNVVHGSFTCTECLRCTQICPAGIDLQDIWLTSKKKLAASGLTDADETIRARSARQWAHALCTHSGDKLSAVGSGLADHPESFWNCVQCTTCTGVCPVVAVSEDPQQDLDLTPQQIMNFLRMGLKAQTLGARMVWSCATCYKCQEHCPQGVPVADILYELRQLGAQTLRQPGKP